MSNSARTSISEGRSISLLKVDRLDTAASAHQGVALGDGLASVTILRDVNALASTMAALAKHVEIPHPEDEDRRSSCAKAESVCSRIACYTRICISFEFIGVHAQAGKMISVDRPSDAGAHLFSAQRGSGPVRAGRTTSPHERCTKNVGFAGRTHK